MNTVMLQIDNIDGKHKLNASYNNITMIYYDGHIITTENNNQISNVSYHDSPYYDNATKLNRDLDNPYNIRNNPILYTAITLRKGIWEIIPNCKVYGTIEYWALTQLRKITFSIPCNFSIIYQYNT